MFDFRHYLKSPDLAGFCESAPEGCDVYSFVLVESLLSPSGAAYLCSDVAPDGACELFPTGTINISRRWRFQMPNLQNQAGSTNLR
jgi:hypothetical protein